MSVAQIEDALHQEADERLFFTGGQLYVSVDGEPVVDVAVGVDAVGTAICSDSLFAVYCAAKPAFVACLGHLVQSDELSFHDQIGDVVGGLQPATACLTIEDLLTHTAGLHSLDAHTFLGLGPEGRERLLTQAAPASGWRVGQDLAYSQAMTWELLSAAVHALTSTATNAAVERVITPHLRAPDELFVAGMSDETYDRCRDRLVVNAYMFDLDVDPILVERTRRLRCLPSPAFGNSASARGLGGLYEALLGVLRDGDGLLDRSILETMIGSRRSGYDRVLERECSWGLGLMVDLASHEFGGRCSEQAFGHTAYGGMTAAMCDPAFDLVIAMHFNGRIDAESAISYRRPALIDRIYKTVLASRVD